MDYSRIAQYYESRGEYDKAADMWTKCDQAPRAVQLYLKVCARRPPASISLLACGIVPQAPCPAQASLAGCILSISTRTALELELVLATAAPSLPPYTKVSPVHELSYAH